MLPFSVAVASVSACWLLQQFVLLALALLNIAVTVHHALLTVAAAMA